VITVDLTQQNHTGEVHAKKTLTSPAGGFAARFASSVFVQGTLWTRTCGGTNNDYAYSVQQTAHRGIIISGLTESFVEGECVSGKPSGASVLNGPAIITGGKAKTVES